ncbi:hypothetical protein AURDEDRAFT_126486 [Auricularia subglabra TFB-10046 SS5]|nr:hypothetical protein AURDEDRAFT_126486 [Auricularia subglabra TFB-10046 SS5]
MAGWMGATPEAERLQEPAVRSWYIEDSGCWNLAGEAKPPVHQYTFLFSRDMGDSGRKSSVHELGLGRPQWVGVRPYQRLTDRYGRHERAALAGVAGASPRRRPEGGDDHPRVLRLPPSTSPLRSASSGCQARSSSININGVMRAWRRATSRPLGRRDASLPLGRIEIPGIMGPETPKAPQFMPDAVTDARSRAACVGSVTRSTVPGTRSSSAALFEHAATWSQEHVATGTMVRNHLYDACTVTRRAVAIRHTISWNALDDLHLGHRRPSASQRYFALVGSSTRGKARRTDVAAVFASSKKR